jgi:hypothetical protein
MVKAMDLFGLSCFNCSLGKLGLLGYCRFVVLAGISHHVITSFVIMYSQGILGLWLRSNVCLGSWCLDLNHEGAILNSVIETLTFEACVREVDIPCKLFKA